MKSSHEFAEALNELITTHISDASDAGDNIAVAAAIALTGSTIGSVAAILSEGSYARAKGVIDLANAAALKAVAKTFEDFPDLWSGAEAGEDGQE